MVGDFVRTVGTTLVTANRLVINSDNW